MRKLMFAQRNYIFLLSHCNRNSSRERGGGKGMNMALNHRMYDAISCTVMTNSAFLFQNHHNHNQRRNILRRYITETGCDTDTKRQCRQCVPSSGNNASIVSQCAGALCRLEQSRSKRMTVKRV